MPLSLNAGVEKLWNLRIFLNSCRQKLQNGTNVRCFWRCIRKTMKVTLHMLIQP